VSVRRRYPLAEPVALAARQLKQCEARVALLDRVRPLNWQTERQRLIDAAALAQRPAPRFAYAPAPQLVAERGTLDAIRALDEPQLECTLLAERASELALEAELAESAGSAAFRELASKRFPLPADHRERHVEAIEWAESRAAGVPPAMLHVSDDRRDPSSLWSLLTRRVREKRLAVRVDVVPDLVSLAAVADEVVRIRPGARLTVDVAARIVLHEVDGHVLPRLAGKRLGGVFLAGSARGNEQEEGRALLLEQRSGLLGLGRRAEIGLRYLAATSVRAAADFWQTFEVLREHGASLELAVELSGRVHRGGGLGRELSYLTGYAEVRAAFERRPELELFLQSGRISTSAAERLLAAGSVELDDDRDVI
jgi:hypothetical protein